MPIQADGFWYPDIFGKQLDVFNNTHRIMLVSGPRLSSKTWAVLEYIVRHMWDTPDGSVAIYGTTMKKSKEGGIWQLLHKTIIPEWVKANIGFRYTTYNSEGTPGWKIMGDTRTPYFKITNRHGGESECRLFSLDYVDDIDDKAKGQHFSLVYFSELSEFESRKVLSTTLNCLRMPHLKYEQHRWVADTNPSEEGESSWIYDVFYRERVMGFEQYQQYCSVREIPPMTESEFLDFQRSLRLVEMFPEDNIHLDPRQLADLKSNCRYDPDLYARDVLGQWIFGQGSQSRHFRALFKPDLHVLGDISSPDENEWEYILPTPNCIDLITGWDPGDTHHAVVLLESHEIGGVKHFSALDELESHAESRDELISLEDFAGEFMELVEALEESMGKTYLLDRSWTDISAIQKYSAAADSFPYLQIESACKGRIVLRGATSRGNSTVNVKVRVKFLKQLIFQGRFKVSANCTGIIRMLRDLKKGKSRLDFVVPNKDKHLFDALTYALIMECAEEFLNSENRANVGKRVIAVQV